MSKLIDLTGEQFGFLTVVERVQDTKPTKWVCKCVCGNTTEVTGSNLRRGHTKSCGCIKGTGIIGRRVGYLVVVEHVSGDRYKCICAAKLRDFLASWSRKDNSAIKAPHSEGLFVAFL